MKLLIEKLNSNNIFVAGNLNAEEGYFTTDFVIRIYVNLLKNRTKKIL